DPSGAHRIEQGADARPAGLAGRVVRAAGGQRVATAAGAALGVGEADEDLARPGRERRDVEIRDLVHPARLDRGGVEVRFGELERLLDHARIDRKSTRLNSSHEWISY